MRRGYIAGDATASDMEPPEAFMQKPRECGLYMVNPFTGWAAQHVMPPEEETEVRFVLLKTTEGESQRRLARMEVCAGCARLLDREYEVAKPEEGQG